MKEDTILVEIASYCDPELFNTIKSAIIQADNPSRIHFAICYQSNNLDMFYELESLDNVKIVHLKESEATGSCYARYLCQKMLEDEKYIYQIDAHMRFVKHWDTLIIKQLLSLNDPKAILSVYPPGLTEEMLKAEYNDPIFDKPGNGGALFVVKFRDYDNYFLKMNSVPFDKNDRRAYKRNFFISAGNFFTFSDAHREVLHDEKMYFYGDELPMALRLYTYGWNIYNPGESYIYHQYYRKNQKFPPVKNGMRNEHDRLKQLLNHELDSTEFGFGNVRTLEEFEKESGIDFKNKIIHRCAEKIDYEDESLVKGVSYFQDQEHKTYAMLHERNNIELLMVDLFGEYEKCIESCLANTTEKSDFKFIIATTKKKKLTEEEMKEKHIKKFVYLDKDAHYSLALSKMTKYLDNSSFVAIIDSGVRFLKEWDTYYCDNLRMSGDNGVLTSWVWHTASEKTASELSPYTNSVKTLETFKDYLPVLKTNDKFKLSQRKTPFQSPFMSNGFLFCRSKVLKDIPIDPNLNYYEHQYIYIVRLWTHGIILYYPTSSKLARTTDEELLNNHISHLDVVCSLMRLENYYSRNLEAGYKYDMGNVRPIWTWYEYINVKYDYDNANIKED